MFLFSAMRDFADGLTRGLSLFLTERQDMTVRVLSPAPASKPAPQLDLTFIEAAEKDFGRQIATDRPR
jgi:hypothetical protein